MMPRRKEKVKPVFDENGIGIDEEILLNITRYATFADLSYFFDNGFKEFLSNNSGLRIHMVPGGFLKGFYLSEMAMSGGKAIASEFENAYDAKRQETVFEFFVRNRLYNLSSSSADEDLLVRFHTKFVS